jgi:phenylacetate-CoA ligase
VKTYGMSEAVAAGSECEHGAQHIWPDGGIPEVVDGEALIGVGRAGEFVCTRRLNQDMLLIPYRVGDGGTMERPESVCACGRLLPGLKEIEGRSDDALPTRDGREVGRLHPVFKAGLPIRTAQIVQEALKVIRLRISDEGYSRASDAPIIDQLRVPLA